MPGRIGISLFVFATLLLAAPLLARTGCYIQHPGADGLVSIEAENYKLNRQIQDHYWKFTTQTPGFSGKGAMVALPDDGANEDDPDYEDTPFIDYQVNFVRTGKHFVWVRGFAVDDGDTCHIDLDKRELDNCRKMEMDKNRWNWTSQSDEDDHAYFEIKKPGLHTISLCMREDGLIVDKIVLTTNPAYRPEGIGPPPAIEGGVLGFPIPQMSAPETARKHVHIPVELAGAPKGTYSVDYAVVGGTAGPEDYILKPGTLKFGPGRTNTVIDLVILPDELDEKDETVLIKLSNPQGKNAQIGLTDTFTYTITDPRPVVQFKYPSSPVTTEQAAVDIPLVLSHPYEKQVSADICVEGEIAGRVVFEPNRKEKNFRIRIKEPIAGKMRVSLADPVNAKLGENVAHTLLLARRNYSSLEGSYYFRYDSGQRWEKYAKVGPHADAMVRIGPGDNSLIFWRGASYLPFFDTPEGKSFVDVIVPRNGDGPGLMFDRTNKFAHIRIVENSPARVIVEWRYLPDFDKTDLQWWTEEYFTVYPDGVCCRSVHTGTETLEEYRDPSHARVQYLLLTDQGICPMPESWIKPIRFDIDKSSLTAYVDLGFDRTRRHYALEARSPGAPEVIRFTVNSNVVNPALFARHWGDASVNVEVNGRQFHNFKLGYAEKLNNNDLVLWFDHDFNTGDTVVVKPVGQSPPVVRAPVRDPYKSEVPLFPEGSPDPGPFGAYYTTLKYWDQWDEPWRVGDYADVVVQFDRSPDRFIFWRGTTNVPHWSNEQNHWYSNEFCERRGGDSGLDGLCEPMQDHDSKFSNVRIIHSSPARAVVHWRYSPVTLSGDIPFVDETGWGDCVDDYYYVYPDETCVRYTTLYTSAPNVFHEWHEAIPVLNPGSYPEDVLDMQALSMANLEGDAKVFNFENGFPPDSELEDGYPIILIGLKGKSKPFAICESAGQWLDPISRPGDSRFNQYDDWPAWPKKYRRGDWQENPQTGYKNYSDFLPSHSSLMHLNWDNYESDYDGPVVFLRRVLLNGMIQTTDVRQLVPLARYWENPPLIKVTGYGFGNACFDKAEKAYKINRRISWDPELINHDDDKKPNKDADTLRLHVLASDRSPIINPCFIINNWPAEKKARLYVNGKEIAQGKDFRQGIETGWDKWEPKSSLVIWTRCSFEQEVTFTIEMVK